MSIKKGFTLLELCVGIILTGITFSIALSFFSQMYQVSINYFRVQIDQLQLGLQILGTEEKLRAKCILFYTDEEILAQKKNKIKAAYRCRF